MSPLFLVLALILQTSVIWAEDVDVPETKDELLESFKKPEGDDQVVKEFDGTSKDWIDLFSMSNSNWVPTSSVAMMSQITNSNKTMEEQLEDMKVAADQITAMLKNEMVNLIAYAMECEKKDAEKEQVVEENSLRKRRSVETPLGSTQMVMRLLKHIKSNNEYQNIAIDKMMSAQEIADKFGIEFNPDPEILSDLAVAANEHAQELATMLKDACELKNVTQEVEFVPVNDEPKENETYFVYSVHPEDEDEELTEDVPSFEYKPEVLPNVEMNHVHSHPEHQPHSHVHHHHVPVTPRPSFYDIFSPDYSYYPVDPLTAAFLLPIEDPEPEPEIVAEEIEETISTKLFVEKGDEPGASTVNHVTTYTVAEKSHYRSPQIDKLPQQYQYCFFLI